MELKVRRIFSIVEERHIEAGQMADPPLRKVAAVRRRRKPLRRRYVAELADMPLLALRMILSDLPSPAEAGFA
ncbi:MAG: hypothetical protein WDN48_18095 [Pseudolabrys sp.]